MATAAILFPGQGSQTVGMGADVAQAFAASLECFERASSVLGYDLLKVCSDGPAEALRDTRVSQPAIFTTNVAIYKAVETLGLRPLVSAGHSFGEYCSLVIAGALTFEQAASLVNERGIAMGEAADSRAGGMAAIIGLGQKEVEALCERARIQGNGRVGVANLNSPKQIVVSGDHAAVDAVVELARADGAKRVVPLNVSGAWHSELMRSAAERFAVAVAGAAIAQPAFAVVSNVDAVPYESVEHIRRCLIESLCARVRWHEAALVVAACKPEFIVECGPTAVLAPMMRRLSGVDAQRCVHVADTAGLAALGRLTEVPADV